MLTKLKELIKRSRKIKSEQIVYTILLKLLENKEISISSLGEDLEQIGRITEYLLENNYIQNATVTRDAKNKVISVELDVANITYEGEMYRKEVLKQLMK